MSNNLSLQQVASNQAQKEVTINAATGQLDAAITENLDCDVTSGSVTLSNSQFQGAVRFKIKNATVASRQLIVPAIKHLFMVTADPATNTVPVSVVKGTTSFDLDPGDTALFYTDGTANGMVQVAGGGAGLNLAVSFIGKPGAGDTLLYYIFTGTTRFPVGLTGSFGVVRIAPAGPIQFTIKKNGSTVGTVNVAASATVATFTFATLTTFIAGDIMTIVAPNPQDANMTDVAITLLGAL